METSELIEANILVVDNDIEMRDSFKSILKREGFSARLARGGRDAIRQQEKNPADIIILDMKMPGVDGPKAIKSIREFDSTVEFIAVSGFADDYKNAVKDEVYRFIDKPMMSKRDQQVLVNSVEEALLKVCEKRKEEKKKKERSLISNNDSVMLEKVRLLFGKWVDTYSDKDEKNLHFGERQYSLEDIRKEVCVGSEIGKIFFDSFIQDFEDHLDSISDKDE